MQSATQENVVNYTVVVDVSNDDGRLLPGMTAVVDFLIDRAEDVLMVPNAALRFRPTPAMLAAVSEGSQRGPALADTSARLAANGRAVPASRPAGGGFMPGANGFGFGGAGDSVMIWYLDAAGRLQMTMARVGITDGSMTEISGPNVTAGLQVIAGVTQSAGSNVANPFQTGNGGGGGRRFGAF